MMQHIISGLIVIILICFVVERIKVFLERRGINYEEYERDYYNKYNEEWSVSLD